MREFLKGLDLDPETIDYIMAEHGKLVTRDKEELQILRGQVKELTENSINAEELQSKYNKLLKDNEEREAKTKAEEESKALEKDINALIGGKKFVNDFTKNAIIDEYKTAREDSANEGKSTEDLFKEIISGKEGIFASSNQVVNMPDVDESMGNTISKEAFDKMGYKERVELKHSNPELFNKYNNQ